MRSKLDALISSVRKNKADKKRKCTIGRVSVLALVLMVLISSAFFAIADSRIALVKPNRDIIYTDALDLISIIPREWNSYTYIYDDGAIGVPKKQELVFDEDGTFEKTTANGYYTGVWFVKDGILEQNYDESKDNLKYKKNVYVEYKSDINKYLLYIVLSNDDKYVLIADSDYIEVTPTPTVAPTPTDTPIPTPQPIPTTYKKFESDIDLRKFVVGSWEELAYINSDGTKGDPADDNLIIKSDGTFYEYTDKKDYTGTWIIKEGKLHLKFYATFEKEEVVLSINIQYSPANKIYLLNVLKDNGDKYVFQGMSSAHLMAQPELEIPNVKTTYTKNYDLRKLLIRKWENYTYINPDGTQRTPVDVEFTFYEDFRLKAVRESSKNTNQYWTLSNNRLKEVGFQVKNDWPIFIEYDPAKKAYLLFLERDADEPGAYFVMISYIGSDGTQPTATPPQNVPKITPTPKPNTQSDADKRLKSIICRQWREYGSTGVDMDIYTLETYTTTYYENGTFAEVYEGEYLSGTWSIKNGNLTMNYSDGKYDNTWSIKIKYDSSIGAYLLIFDIGDGATFIMSDYQ